MHWKKKSYLVHRWLGLLISIQLLAWSVGGLVFSLLDIEKVRGNRDRVVAAPLVIKPHAGMLRSEQAVALAKRELGDVDVTGLVLRSRQGRLVFDVLGPESRPLAVVSADDGGVSTDVGAKAAGLIAAADFRFSTQVQSVQLIQDEAPLEYRGKRLPAYRVVLDHAEAPHIYVCAVTGEVLARRNQSWRIFDFFWMLHIMDYSQREDFNHWLLTVASALAVATSATGILLWGLRLRRKKQVTR
ncbi:MAG: PepSY domain-containing protein [Phycisphaerae bacterium]|nr:PepSY domain-containing protein [Phycisphaerales bacterium]